jgi:phospholipid/cholesterol/gamma-HCH transport system permease protein
LRHHDPTKLHGDELISATARLALGYSSMLVHAFTRRGLLRMPEVRSALARQIQVTGVQALPYVLGVALLFGAVVVTRALELLGPDDDTALKAVVWGGIRELGPLVTALIIIVRSSVAIAAEVALMRLRGGIHDSHWRDILHEEEVVLPRVLGAAASAAALVSCFQFVAIASALVASAITLGTTVEFELDSFLTTASWSQVPLSIGKGILFGTGIGVIACYHGLQVNAEVGALPKAVVAAGAGSLTFVLVADLIAVSLLFS